MPQTAERHKEYMRDRYNNDPIHRERHKKKTAETRRRNLRRWQEFKLTLKCERCGESHPATLDFHHTNPDDKEANLSIAAASWGWDRLMEEVSKCEVICSNCHRKHHYMAL